MSDMIAVLDFGAQYSQLIARRVRECGVYSEIFPYNVKAEKLRERKIAGIILSGGPMSVTSDNAPMPDPAIFSLSVPVLGICYGEQVMAKVLGGSVKSSIDKEYGYQLLVKDIDTPLLKDVSEKSVVWMSHGDSVERVPDGFVITGTTETCDVAVMENSSGRLYGLQFHPEVAHSEEGEKILRNFVVDICSCECDWNMGSFIEKSVAGIRETVGDSVVLCGLSGGVDSSVTAALLNLAIGNRLHCVFVNNGMLRKGESDEVIELFSGTFKMNLHYVDATDDFLSALKGVTDPEEKRKIIGRLFIDTFYKEANKIPDVSFLAQGTLYPDVIESKSAFGGPSSTIKSHHNVGGLPSDLKWKLLEPLKDLFKDEVRVLGRELGLPCELVNRHPFPGPGLGVRCVGEVTKERLDVLREIDFIFIDEIKKAGIYDLIWQAFADLLPVKSVGVQGDERTYREVCTLRAVTSEDAMTADFFRFPYDILRDTALRICNTVPYVNRVLYDITSKPPGTIEWE